MVFLRLFVWSVEAFYGLFYALLSSVYFVRYGRFERGFLMVFFTMLTAFLCFFLAFAFSRLLWSFYAFLMGFSKGASLS